MDTQQLLSMMRQVILAQNESLSPEDLRDNWAAVTDQADYATPNGLGEETALFIAAMKR